MPSETASKTTRKMHFSIDGEWLTNLVRQVWVEGDMAKAMHILSEGFPEMPETTRMAIIMGKKKLVGTDRMTIEDDDCKESCGIPIVSMEEQIAAKERKLQEREEALRIREEWEAGETETMSSPWGLIKVPRSMCEKGYRVSGMPYYFIKCRKGEEYSEAMDRFAEMFPEEVEDAKARTQHCMSERRQQDYLRALGMDAANLKASSDAVLRELTRPRQAPVWDRELHSLNGWITPDGKFYGCGFMGHIGLAADMGTTEGEIERSWVKVQDPQDPLALIPREGGLCFMGVHDRTITQAQYDTMFAWCQKHGQKLPADLEIA